VALPRDPLRLALQVLLYIFLYVAAAFVLGSVLELTGAYLFAITVTGLLAATVANGLCMRIYEQRRTAAIGLHWDRASLANLGYGCLGGAGAAAVVLALPVAVHAARIAPDPSSDASVAQFFFVTLMLLFGSAGEEMLFRGYGFQVLVRGVGGWATVLPVGLIFGALHAANPYASRLSVANTMGFGIVFGYAFLRSRDLWLPIGLHFGWNFTLPLFGVNVSGLTMRLTDLSMKWSAGTLWSGGEYGPEASILTSAVLVLLLAYVWKAPIRRQPSVLLDPPSEVTCEPGQPLSPFSGLRS